MNILVTGGAGFIGSNIVEALLQKEEVSKVRVLDNLATGHKRNIEGFFSNPKFEFIEGDIRNIETCRVACKGINRITHQAALGSVPRSINDPLTSNAVNITGTLNIFTAAKEAGIKRVVFAASSSTYGDSKKLPKIEDEIGMPLSPYAVTKYVNELYASVYGNLFDLEYVGLRYFNIFGPKQDSSGAYAAVIPLFFKAAIDNQSPAINGDGTFSRDFTYVDNAVEANLLALFTDNPAAVKQIYNIACGERTSLTELWTAIREIVGTSVDASYGPSRQGDVPHSLANIEKAKKRLNYTGNIHIKEGLEKAFSWYSKSL